MSIYHVSTHVCMWVLGISIMNMYYRGGMSTSVVSCILYTYHVLGMSFVYTLSNAQLIHVPTTQW